MAFVCDICCSPIAGVRYRCLVCPGEFDICKTCKDSKLPLDPPHEDAHPVEEMKTIDHKEMACDFYRDHKTIEVTIGSRAYERMLTRIEGLFSRGERVSWELTVGSLKFYQNRSNCNNCHLDCNETLCPMIAGHSKREHIDKHIRDKYQGKVPMQITGTYMA